MIRRLTRVQSVYHISDAIHIHINVYVIARTISGLYPIYLT